MKKIQLLLLLTLTATIVNAQTKNFIDQPHIEVTGSADTLVTPDEIFIRIIITEKDTRDRIPVEELEAKMVAALKALGINTEEALTASDMASNFKFYFLKSKDVLKTKQYTLKVGDAAMASKVFVQLEELGISNTSIERVSHSRIEQLKNGIRSMAMENAKTRAVALVKPLGQNIGPAIHIADTEIYNFNNNNSRSELQEVVVTGYAVRGATSIQQPKIEFEKIKVATNISVKFILK